MYPSFGLLLSCFGQARAEKKSELSCGLSRVSPFVGTVIRLSSQSCEGIVLLRYAVVGILTVESRIGGWVCLRKLVFEVISLAFILS